MTILITGGAGYIGSHCVKALVEQGADVAVIDNLSTGFQEAVTGGRLYVGDLRDRAFVHGVFARETIGAVVHFAAFSQVGESVKDPGKYYGNNIGGAAVLLDEMAASGVKNLVFSSTAAVYGEPEKTPIVESDPTLPTNPYGETKLAIERMAACFERAYGIRCCALRYFNVAGASPDGSIGEAHDPETHLIPLVLQAALGARDSITIFGEDYPTPDGTCIRDYVHVCDLIDGHLKALAYLEQGGKSDAFNLGIGHGFSVREIIEAVKRVTGREFPVRSGARRAGDPSILIASGEKARRVLGWEPKHTEIDGIIADAWRWHKNKGHYSA